MTPQDWLSSLANVAAIVTGIVAAFAGTNVLWRRRARRIRLEEYLKKQRSDDTGDNGVRNIVHLMGNCLMSKAQVLEAAFASRKIKSWVATDSENGPDLELMFQYNERPMRKPTNSPKKSN